eukprot:TRINITY_DN35565_c0_g1_i1.p1 TRINITY_DN35565_c0_g1~~TRINITY_DN35565_c0_g1_i1.p1  ORF type:complete len:294 (-),score=23.74 TRINITY_DN35565_c0_g1_i1:275-1156(-)
MNRPKTTNNISSKTNKELKTENRTKESQHHTYVVKAMVHQPIYSENSYKGPVAPELPTQLFQNANGYQAKNFNFLNPVSIYTVLQELNKQQENVTLVCVFLVLLVLVKMSGIMSMWQSFLDWLRSLFFKKEMEITLIGLQNAGKTTFVEVLSGGGFHAEMSPTVGFNMKKFTKGRVTIKLWDIGGQQRFRSMWERYCRAVQAILFMVDAADHDKLDQSFKELNQLLVKPSLAGIPLLVLGNKNDLPGALNTSELSDRMQLQDVRDREVSVYCISCKNQTNLDKVLEWLTAHAK